MIQSRYEIRFDDGTCVISLDPNYADQMSRNGYRVTAETYEV